MLALNEGDTINGDASVASKVDYTLHGIVGTTVKQLANGQLAATEGTLYTSTTDGVAVTAIVLVNTDTSARTANLYLHPKGGTSRRIVPKNISLSAGYCLYANGVEIKVIDTSGMEQSSAIALDDTPVDGQIAEAITSNWAYDHAAATTGVHGVTGTVLGTEDVDDTPVDGETTVPVSSNWAYDTAARLDDVSQSEPNRELETEYQNTGGKIRIAVISCRETGGSNTSVFTVYVKSTSPANDIMARIDCDPSRTQTVTFPIPPSYYYVIKETGTGTGALNEWHEWDLL